MSKPSILIVNPYIEDFAAYDHFSKPLGAMLLASALKPHFRLHFVNALNRTHPDIPKMRFRSDGTGHFHKTFIPKPDCLSDIPRRFKRYGIPEELFLRELRNTPFEPDYVFVTSGMTYWASGVRTTNRLIRSVFPRARIVLGGIYASLLPKHAAVYSESDDVCARQMLPNVLQFVSQLTGIDCRTDGLPAPDYELLSEKYYVPVYTSLGCVFDCSYCASSRLSQFTEFPTMQTAQTIVRLAKTQSVRNFAFYDDALLARSETRLNPILKHIAESGIQVRFYTPNGMHIRFLTEETARLMRITGFEDIRLSLESDDPLFQATEGRKTTNIEFESALETLFRAGFESKQIHIYTLVNVPGQSYESIEETMRYIASMRAIPRLAFYSPIPGTPDFERAARITDVSEPLFQNNTVYLYRSGFGIERLNALVKMELEWRKKMSGE